MLISVCRLSHLNKKSTEVGFRGSRIKSWKVLPNFEIVPSVIGMSA
jgi:hypothetical protein